MPSLLIGDEASWRLTRRSFLERSALAAFALAPTPGLASPPRTGHRLVVRWICWDRTGARAATTSLDQRLIVWDWRRAQGRLLRTLPKGPSLVLGWDHSGANLVLYGADIQLIREADGQTVAALGDPLGLRTAELSPSGRTIALSLYGTGIELRSATDGKLQRLLAEPEASFGNLAWSPDEAYLMAADSNRGFTLFDTESGIMLRQSFRPASRFSWRADSRCCAVTSPEGMVVFVSNTRWPFFWPRYPWVGGTPGAAFSPAGQTLVHWEGGKSIHLDTEPPRERLRLIDSELAEDPTPPGFLWSPDGKLLAVRKPEGRLTIWDAERGKRISDPVCDRGFIAAAWRPSSRFLLLGDSYGALWTWDAKTRRTALRFPAIPEPKSVTPRSP